MGLLGKVLDVVCGESTKKDIDYKINYLMSLWKIDDTATQILMVEFYRALLNGHSPTQALHNAQDILRRNPKYSSPFYWASFIILDDIS